MATLIVTPFTPREGTGRGLRTIGVARALARTDDVEIAYIEFDGSRPSATLRSERRLSLRKLEASRGPSRAAVYARARMAGIPRGFARGISRELMTGAEVGRRFERVVADGPIAAAALLLLARSRRVVYNAHNLESGFRSGLSTGQRDYGDPERLQAFERKIMTGASETWLPTFRDMREAATVAPGATLRYVPNVVDVRAISPVPPSGAGRVLFLADFSYEPNRNAARLLVHDVMPRLWKINPAARLALVGRSPEFSDDVDRRIEVLGFVEDLDGQYAMSDCAVVPLLEGGGSPLKLIEALAYGLPVVATPLAASGLEAAKAGIHYVEAYGPGPLAESLASVLGGESAEIGPRGRELVEAEYSIEALASLLARSNESPR